MRSDGMSISSIVNLIAAAFLLIAGFYLWDDDVLVAIGCVSAGVILACLATLACKQP